MTDPNALGPEHSLNLPLQAPPIRRNEDSVEEAIVLAGGVEAAGCGDLTGMAQELCYASQYGIYY